jgi:AcrR family transcriptional regulator
MGERGGDLLRRILGRDESDRRIVIIRALWRLMLEKGYASTSLTDVAKKAGLSPSHLAYYFPTKDAIVLQLYDALQDSLLSITAHQNEPPVEQCHLLATYAFLEPVMDVDDRTIALELTGIAVHNRRFQRRNSEYSTKMHAYLKNLFSKTPRAFNLSAGDAALLAGSMWMGLLTNSFFYKGFDRARARALFRQSLLMLAGLSDQQAVVANRRGAESAPNRRRARAAKVSAGSHNGGDFLKRILGEDNSDRRIVILRGLWRLMLEKGYASTTLTDVARKARLSPSHLAYYYPNKEAILLKLYDALTDGLLSLTAHRDEPPIEQFERLAGHAFLEPLMDIDDRTIALEIIGIAVHNPRLRDRNSEYAQKMIGYLRELFAKTPRAFNLSAEDAAVVAASVWMGLLTNSYFHKGFDRTRARVLFRWSLLLLAGLADEQFAWLDQHRHKRERNGTIAHATLVQDADQL